MSAEMRAFMNSHGLPFLLIVCGLASVAARAAEQPAPTALAGVVLEHYEKFTIPERQAAIAGLSVRADTAALLLDAMEKEGSPGRRCQVLSRGRLPDLATRL